MAEKKVKCPRCGEVLKFELIAVDKISGLLSLCCGSSLSELKTDWGLAI